jgi:hypothetical protein
MRLQWTWNLHQYKQQVSHIIDYILIYRHHLDLVALATKGILELNVNCVPLDIMQSQANVKRMKNAQTSLAMAMERVTIALEQFNAFVIMAMHPAREAFAPNVQLDSVDIQIVLAR